MQVNIYGERKRELIHDFPSGYTLRINVSASYSLERPGSWEPAQIYAPCVGRMNPGDAAEYARALLAALDVARQLDALDPEAEDVAYEAEARLRAFLELPSWARAKALAPFQTIDQLLVSTEEPR